MISVHMAFFHFIGKMIFSVMVKMEKKITSDSNSKNKNFIEHLALLTYIIIIYEYVYNKTAIIVIIINKQAYRTKIEKKDALTS